MIDKQRLRTFLLGGALGALAGILLAPRSGRELRGNLANRTGEFRERGRETYFEAQERLQERIAETREGSYRSPERDPVAEASVGASSPVPGEMPDGRPRLRDVSEQSHGNEPHDARSEELRKKVQETRARLREHLDDSEEPDEE